MSDPRQPSTTEDGPVAPGWVESELDEILAGLPGRPSMTALRNTYLDCVALSEGPIDVQDARARCRARFVEGLREEGVAPHDVEALDHRLAALEAELDART